MIGRVYEIANTDRSIVYVGSTVQKLSQRWAEHKSRFNAWMNGYLHRSCSIFYHFRDYGFDNFSISLVSEHFVNEISQLRIFEQQVIDTTENTCNRIRAYLSNEERRVNNNSRAREYQTRKKIALQAETTDQI